MERPDERPVATVDQIAALVDAVDPRYRVMVLVAAWCGLRFGELASLTRRGIDISSGAVRVRRQLQEMADGRLVYGPPKTAAAVRSVAIPPHVLVEVRRHLETAIEPSDDAVVSPLPTVTSCAGRTSPGAPGTPPAEPWASGASASTICATRATRWPHQPAPARGS